MITYVEIPSFSSVPLEKSDISGSLYTTSNSKALRFFTVAFREHHSCFVVIQPGPSDLRGRQAVFGGTKQEVFATQCSGSALQLAHKGHVSNLTYVQTQKYY